MKKSIFLAIGLAMTMALAAEYKATEQDPLYYHILTGAYDATLLSVPRQDSILGVIPMGRYRVEQTGERETLFRHSYYARYQVWDTLNNTRKPLSDELVRDVKVSPNGKYAVYAKKDNNLYICKLEYMSEQPVTSFSPNRQIFAGISDWLYEEEFGITGLAEWSQDSKFLAYVRLDETEVPTFTWQEFLSDSAYPSQYTLRYPKSGQNNASARVFVYDVYYRSSREMKVSETDCYLPRIAWRQLPTNDKKNPMQNELLVLRLNRNQNKQEVLAVNPQSTVAYPLYRENSDKFFIDYALFDSWKWLSDNKFIALTEKNGWRQAILHSPTGAPIRELTPIGIDVTQIYAVDEATGILYYQAATTPMTRHGYAVNYKKNAQPIRITNGEGTHTLRFSRNGKQYIDNFESVTTPNRYTLYNTAKNTRVREILNNDSIAAAYAATGVPPKEFIRIPTERGDTLNAYRVMPTNYQEGKQYPTVVMHYSGPASQRVLNRWRRRFEHGLSSEGYLLVCVDVRGTDCRGREWRNATYKHLGEVEAEDLITTGKWLKTLQMVDTNRICLMGWSYGGYQTIRTMCTEGNPYRKGVAIAPVSDWRLYDTGYAERYMQTPGWNDMGYDGSDITRMANRLSGELLLVHGAADDNVHLQHTMKMIDALVQADKEFQLMIYPDDNHFLKKRNNYRDLHRRILRFLKEL